MLVIDCDFTDHVSFAEPPHIWEASENLQLGKWLLTTTKALTAPNALISAARAIRSVERKTKQVPRWIIEALRWLQGLVIDFVAMYSF